MKTNPKAKTPKSDNLHRGGSFSDFLEEEGVLPEVTALALKRVLALQLQDIIEKENVTKGQLAARMHTSRAAVDRLLDPGNSSLTVASLGKAAAALGRKLEVRFVPA
jgi:antitoxin HicB